MAWTSEVWHDRPGCKGSAGGRVAVAKITASLRLNLGNLARFSGRDTPGQFWPWTIIIFLLSVIAAFVVMMPPIMRMMIGMFREIDAAGPQPAGDPLPPEVIELLMAGYAAELGALWLPMTLINLATVALLAAGFVRRLHDVDRPGLWALLPIPPLAVSLATMEANMAVAVSGRAATAWEAAASSTSALYWLAVIVLIVFLVGDGTRGPNRFGPDPRAAS